MFPLLPGLYVSYDTGRQMACTECRKRKQKCSHGQPCSGCARRYPQPVCQYPPPRIKHDQATRVVEHCIGSGRAASPHGIDNDDVPLDESQTKLAACNDVPYSHLNVEDLESPSFHMHSSSEREHFKHGNFVRTGCAIVDLEQASVRIPICPKEGSLVLAGRQWHTAETVLLPEALFRLFKSRCSTVSRLVEAAGKLEGISSLTSNTLVTQTPNDTLPSIDLVDLLDLPMADTNLNKELLRLHLQILSRFKVSVDGNPPQGNLYLKRWIPFNLQNPLLLQIVLFTSASFLNEQGTMPEVVVLAMKHEVYHRLKKQLDTPATQFDDVAIMAVTQLVMDSWYWGADEDLATHVAGLKNMIMLRGGLQELGLQGCLAKTVLMHDICLALAHQCPTQIYGHSEFEYVERRDSSIVPAHSSPFLLRFPSFQTCLYSNQLGERSRWALDEMRSVFRSTFFSSPLQSQQAATSLLGGLKQELSDTVPRSTRTSSAARFTEGYQTVVHRCVCLIAQTYCEAIRSRMDTSHVLGPEKALEIWQLVWSVPLNEWKNMVGVFTWIMIAIVPSVHGTYHARFIKTMLVVGFMCVGMEAWHVSLEMADAALGLQKWLKSSASSPGLALNSRNNV